MAVASFERPGMTVRVPGAPSVGVGWPGSADRALLEQPANARAALLVAACKSLRRDMGWGLVTPTMVRENGTPWSARKGRLYRVGDADHRVGGVEVLRVPSDEWDAEVSRRRQDDRVG